MESRGPVGCSKFHRSAIALFLLFAVQILPAFTSPHEATAQTLPPGYDQADQAFMQMTLDQRVKLQILLTASGYWPAVPNADYSIRLFSAITQFEVENGFVPLGIITDEQMNRLLSVGGSYLSRWRFEPVKHPMTNVQIWVPFGLQLVQESIPSGLRFVNHTLGMVLTFDAYNEFRVGRAFESLLGKLQRSGVRIYYSKLTQNAFFVLSYSDGITDAYVRYHQLGRGGIGITLYWNHTAADAHIERIATLISGSLWSAVTGAPFTSPFSVRPQAPETVETPGPSPEPQPHSASSATGIFVTTDGHILTNAHVVKDCSEIRVGMGQGDFEVGRLVAKDPTNDLALVKITSKPRTVGAFHFDVRLGENVEAFGYPLSQILATTGNFTTGNVTALAGIGDDSRFFQISAPVQPGNSGGPLLDENGNLIGIVSSKLNFLSEIKNAGDIPQNVNFAIKASVAANFLRDNNVKFQFGEASQPMKAPDLADQAKSLSAYIECR